MDHVGEVERLPLTRKDVDFEVQIDFSVSGCYRPGKTDGDPDVCFEAEYPELEVFSIHAVNVRTQKPMPKELRLSDEERDRLEREILAVATRPHEYDGY